MSSVVTRQATYGDAWRLSQRLRPVEVDEITAATGRPVQVVIFEAVRDSEESWITEIDGELACLWGVVRMPGEGVGCGWLLTSDVVERKPKAFWKACLAALPRLLSRWAVLTNAIDVRHAQAIRWAERLGFALEAPRPWGAAGLPFRVFTVTQEDLRCALQ